MLISVPDSIWRTRSNFVSMPSLGVLALPVSMFDRYGLEMAPPRPLGPASSQFLTPLPDNRADAHVRSPEGESLQGLTDSA